MIAKAADLVVIALMSAVVLVAAAPRELAEESDWVAGGDCPCAYTDTCYSICGGAQIDFTTCVTTPETGYGCEDDPNHHPCGIAIQACGNLIGVKDGASGCPG